MGFAGAMGLSGALLDRIIYDEDEHNVTGSPMDYGMAAASDLPSIEIVSYHSPNTGRPIGSKGMLAPFGVVAERQLLTPEAVLTLLHRRG